MVIIENNFLLKVKYCCIQKNINFLSFIHSLFLFTSLSLTPFAYFSFFLTLFIYLFNFLAYVLFSRILFEFITLFFS